MQPWIQQQTHLSSNRVWIPFQSALHCKRGVLRVCTMGIHHHQVYTSLSQSFLSFQALWQPRVEIGHRKGLHTHGRHGKNWWCPDSNYTSWRCSRLRHPRLRPFSRHFQRYGTPGFYRDPWSRTLQVYSVLITILDYQRRARPCACSNRSECRFCTINWL